MKPKVVIIGANGHAKVIIDIIKACDQYNIVGCTDIVQTGSILGVPILGDDTVLQDLYREGIENVVVAIGDNRLRKKISENVKKQGFNLVKAISPKACISPFAQIGAGTVVMPGAIINADCVIGGGVIVNTGATVDHDCIIKDYVHIAPGCNLAGFVKVEDGCFLGIGTKVIPQKNIGSWSVIGAGSVVIHDITKESTSVGVPAKILKNTKR